MEYTDYTTCDYDLFLWLNFDGGMWLDKAMLIISGTTMWLPLYALILWLVYRQAGWRNTLLFTLSMVLAIVLGDMIAGIFKQNGVLGELLPHFQARLRPMFTPALEGLVHFPAEAIGGRYGTVSAHAATIAALALLSAAVIRRRWFSWLVLCSTLLICYSRIYLAKHFPLDLLWGTLTGLVVGALFWLLYQRLKCKKVRS